MKASFNINYVANDPQYINLSQGGEQKKRMSRTVFIHTLIRENAIHHNDSYSLFSDDLSHEDKKVFLSYLCSANDYEDFCSNPTRLNAAFDEYREEMQFFINQELDDVYHEDMRECGMCLTRDLHHGDYTMRRI